MLGTVTVMSVAVGLYTVSAGRDAICDERQIIIITIIIHLLGQAPEGCLAAPDTAQMRGRAWSPINP
jgi:hypothetical protein